MSQSDTKTENQLPPADENVTRHSVLTEAQQKYISYKSVAGLGVKSGEPTAKVSMQEFADSIGYSRRQLYRWEETIPNFWQLVKERRMAIMGRDMVANVWQRIYLDALAGKAEQQKIIVGAYDEWKPPAQSHDVKMSGWADVINKARLRKDEDAGTDTNN